MVTAVLWYTDGQGEPINGSITEDGLELSERNHIEDATTKQQYILLCSEKALYVYSLVHAIQVMHESLTAIIGVMNYKTIS